MTRLLLLLSFNLFATLSFGQKEKEREFYTFLQTKIKEASPIKDTISITEVTKACLGSTWKAIIKPEGNFTTVVFYVDKSNGPVTDTSTSLLQTVVDTAFTIPTSTLLDNLESEISYLKNNLVISYTTTEYLIQQGDTKNRFKLEKGQGLYYLLRFNKSWTQYLTER